MFALKLLNIFSVICDYGANKCMFSCQQTNEKRDEDLRDILNNKSPKDCAGTSAKSSNFRLSKRDNNSFTNVFINGGLILSVYIMMSFSLVFAIISAIFSLTNIWFSSTYEIANVKGLYYWNGLVIFFTTLTMILYGILFNTSIVDNIAVAGTLTETPSYSSQGLASLGYSYWILFLPIILHSLNIVLVKYRFVQLHRSKPNQVLSVDKVDSTILVY